MKKMLVVLTIVLTVIISGLVVRTIINNKSVATETTPVTQTATIETKQADQITVNQDINNEYKNINSVKLLSYSAAGNKIIEVTYYDNISKNIITVFNNQGINSIELNQNNQNGELTITRFNNKLYLDRI